MKVRGNVLLSHKECIVGQKGVSDHVREKKRFEIRLHFVSNDLWNDDNGQDSIIFVLILTFKKKTLVSDLIPVWVVTLIFILVLVGYLYSYPQSPQTFFFPSHDCTPHTMHSLWDNKTFPLSFIRILPLFHSIFYFHGNKTFLSTSSCWFSYLIDLLFCYKLG